MAPSAETIKQLRWSQEEIDILVRMTNHQLELEAQDKKLVISWSQHWKKVSARLKEHGYHRSFTACRGIWKRGVEAQRASRDAAGPEWDDSEHEILVYMTKKQLGLEKDDSSAIIPWAKHWKRVSLQLEEQGFSRSPENCAAYWELVEDGEQIASEMEEDEDGQLATDEEVPPPDLPVISPQAPKSSAWSSEEYENLLGLLKARRDLEEQTGIEFLSGQKFWTEIAQQHRRSGYDRTPEACKAYWHKQGREMSKYDERAKPSPDPSSADGTTKSNNAESKRSSLSVCSPVNGTPIEDSIDVSKNPAFDALERFQQEHAQGDDQDDSSLGLKSGILQSDALLVGETESDIEFIESGQVQSEKKQRKKGLTNFRLTQGQREILAAEIAKNGIIPNSVRKAELAQELGLEYKTVRNWFTNYNVKVRRSQGSTPNIHSATSANMFEEDFRDNEPQPFHDTHPFVSTPTPNLSGVPEFRVGEITTGLKRPHSADFDSVPKKNRVEPDIVRSERWQEMRHNSGFNPVNGTSGYRPPVPQSETASTPQLARSPVVSSQVVREPEFIAASNTGSGARDSPIASQRSLPDSSRSAPRQMTPYPTRMSYNASVQGPNVNETVHLSYGGESLPLLENTKAISETTPPNALLKNNASTSEVTTQDSAVTTFITQYARADTYTTSAAFAPKKLNDNKTKTQNFMPPNQRMPTQPPVRMDYDNSTSFRPMSTPLTSNYMQSLKERQDGMPVVNSAPQTTPVAAAFPLNPTTVDAKTLALRQVQTLNSEIEVLKHTSAVRIAKISDFSRQLEDSAKRRDELNGAKQAEIKRAVEEIEKRYGGNYRQLLRHEDLLQGSRDAEVEELKKNEAELSKKEKGRTIWQQTLDYCNDEAGGS